MFTVHFSVTVPFELIGSQHIYVTGSHNELGNWEVDRAIKLNKCENGKWTGIVTLGVETETVRFRYFVGYYLQSETNKPPTLIVTKWESHLTPRSVIPPVEATKTGVCRANLHDVFGYSGGRQTITSNWVLNDDQNQIMLTLHGQALKFFQSKRADRKYSIKIVPFDLRNKFDLPDDQNDDNDENDDDQQELPNFPSYSHTEIAVLTSENSFNFGDQREFGEPYNERDYLIFRTRSVAVEHLGFRVEVYYTATNELSALGYALPSSLHDTYGKTSLPLLNKSSKPIGKIYFDYLFIRPLKLLYKQPLMNNCYARHWKKRTTLEVGHRGMGNSYTKCAVARENTLHSLNSAAKHGADFVEFDVHLTKDKVPVIFHDFHVLVAVAKRINTSADSDTDDGLKKDTSAEFYQLAVKDLNLNQLRLLHLEHIHSNKSVERSSSDLTTNAKHVTCENEEVKAQRITCENDEAEEHRPFPTLNEVLSNVSSDVGFNIEIKYPQVQINGQNECDGYFERNEFVDIILAETFNVAGLRRIVFSSFDPDICQILSAKQKKYPVLFLCTGDSKIHMTYVDERTRTSMTAVKFAASEELVGVNFNSEDVLKDPTPIQKAKELGLVTFVWGDDLAEKKNVDYFKKILVDGIIYDRIGEQESRSNVFLLEKAMKNALFAKKTASPVSQHRCSSHGQLNNHRMLRGSSINTWYDSQDSETNPSQTQLAENNNEKNHNSFSKDYPVYRQSRGGPSDVGRGRTFASTSEI